MRKTVILALIISMTPLTLVAETVKSRYFHSGDGKIHIQSAKNGTVFKGTYRNEDGTYDEETMRKIHKAFSATYGDPISAISMRLIEYIDFIEDNLNPGAKITITSGYRSPTYNTNLRKKGRLAAKTSLHQYGMAIDLQLAGVHPERIWMFVREQKFGGVGYYHGANVHIDVGPVRFWDEKTSKVGTGISDENKLIEIITDKDIYLPDETIDMRFIRMTAFPIGVDPTFELERKVGDEKWKLIKKFKPNFSKEASGKCPQFGNIEEMLGIGWTLPKKTKGGRYRVVASFCGEIPESMPGSVKTPEFEVR